MINFPGDLKEGTRGILGACAPCLKTLSKDFLPRHWQGISHRKENKKWHSSFYPIVRTSNLTNERSSSLKTPGRWPCRPFAPIAVPPAATSTVWTSCRRKRAGAPSVGTAPGTPRSRANARPAGTIDPHSLRRAESRR